MFIIVTAETFVGSVCLFICLFLLALWILDLQEINNDGESHDLYVHTFPSFEDVG